MKTTPTFESFNNNAVVLGDILELRAVGQNIHWDILVAVHLGYQVWVVAQVLSVRKISMLLSVLNLVMVANNSAFINFYIKIDNITMRIISITQ